MYYITLCTYYYLPKYQPIKRALLDNDEVRVWCMCPWTSIGIECVCVKLRSSEGETQVAFAG